MKSAYELKVISQQAGGQRSRGRVRQIKTQKKGILMRSSLEGQLGQPQNPNRLAALLRNAFAYTYGRCEDLEIKM